MLVQENSHMTVWELPADKQDGVLWKHSSQEEKKQKHINFNHSEMEEF